jgi:hypothetical protein
VLGWIASIGIDNRTIGGVQVTIGKTPSSIGETQTTIGKTSSSIGKEQATIGKVSATIDCMWYDDRKSASDDRLYVV